jgi:hypothetical protein
MSPYFHAQDSSGIEKIIAGETATELYIGQIRALLYKHSFSSRTTRASSFVEFNFHAESDTIVNHTT